MPKTDTTPETPASETTSQKGAVLAAPGGGTLRWICEDCLPSHERAGWKRASAEDEAAWLAKAIPAGLAPEGATLLERAA